MATRRKDFTPMPRSAADDLGPARVNWGQLRPGTLVINRITPSWGLGVIREKLSDTEYLVAFPGGPRYTTGRAIVCHCTVLKDATYALTSQNSEDLLDDVSGNNPSRKEE